MSAPSVDLVSGDAHTSAIRQICSGLFALIAGCCAGNFAGTFLSTSDWSWWDASPLLAIWTILVCFQYFSGIVSALGIVVFGCLGVFSETGRPTVFSGVFVLQAYLAARRQCDDGLIRQVFERVGELLP